ncbi:MAG TPA: FG-GAP-like repeat-containing protein [candidate division Zixibacteria bacterium]
MREKSMFFLFLFLWVGLAFAQSEVITGNGSSPTDSIPFATAVDYGVGHSPRCLFCADLDGDGDLDLAVANLGANNVSILKNNGSGTFQPSVNYNTGGLPYSLFCADLDLDGDLDLVVANSGSNKVSVLKNNGDGTFQAKVDYDAGSKPVSVFCADLDGDHDQDIAVANYSGDNVSILRNNGDGTFQAKVNYSTGRKPVWVFCADLDGDLDLDLAVADNGSNKISVLKNNGDGTFQAKIDYVCGEAPSSVFCTDLDGDSDLDLSATCSGNSSISPWLDEGIVSNVTCCNGIVSILKNNGDGTFQSATHYEAGIDPRSVFGEDLDGDLDWDLAWANYFNQNVSLLKNYGDGTFQTRVNYTAGSKPVYVFSADLDGDGDFDLAVANYQSNHVSILKNLTQIPANQPPQPFHLFSPCEGETTFHWVDFTWQSAYDPNFGDQIRYDLYLSTTSTFDETCTTIHPDLLVSQFSDSLKLGTYYWKIKAKDNWGAYRWSESTCTFFNSDYLHDTVMVVAFSPVNLIVTDPNGDSVGLDFGSSIPGASYDTTRDYNQDGENDDIALLPNRLVGCYMIRVFQEPGKKGTYSLGIRVDGGALNILAKKYSISNPAEVDTFTPCVPHYMTGDVNSDWVVDIEDVIYLLDYLFTYSPTPDPIERGDTNCDGLIDLEDVLLLINYLFKAGPIPSC